MPAQLADAGPGRREVSPLQIDLGHRRAQGERLFDHPLDLTKAALLGEAPDLLGGAVDGGRVKVDRNHHVGVAVGGRANDIGQSDRVAGCERLHGVSMCCVLVLMKFMIGIDTMNEAHLAAVDLNLLVVLDSLLQTKNLTRTAERLARTPSAVSHALGRLRDLFEDPLLVRTGARMEPTELAMRLMPRVHEIVSGISALLANQEAMDPRRLERTFVIGIADYVEPIVMPALMRALSREAPRVDVRLLRFGDEIDRAVQSGRNDIAIGAFFRPLGGLFVHKLFDDELVTVMRRDHPMAKRSLTLERFVEARHALVTPRGLPGGPVDRALAAQGHARRVVYRTPHFLAALEVVSQTDLVVTIPRRLAKLMAKPLELTMKRTPIEVLPFSVGILFREAQRTDPVNRWLRTLIDESVRGAVRR